MSRITALVKRVLERRRGATMIEYGLLAALVSIAALVALQALGPALLGIFNQIVTALG